MLHALTMGAEKNGDHIIAWAGAPPWAGAGPTPGANTPWKPGARRNIGCCYRLKTSRDCGRQWVTRTQQH